jgi:hypothetical protein
MRESLRECRILAMNGGELSELIIYIKDLFKIKIFFISVYISIFG